MKIKTLSRWLIALVSAVSLSACGLYSAAPAPPPTNTSVPRPPTETSTSTPAPTRNQTPTPTMTPAPTPISFAPDAYKGWLTYTNARYRFSLRHPPEWARREIQGTLNTMSGHAVYLEPRAPSLVRLVVGFKRATEDQQITRTGVGSGEIVRRGSVAFLGEPVGRDLLVWNGRDYAILYQGSGEIRRGDLVFSLSLDYRGAPADKTALTPEMETIADKIVASFE